MLARWSLKRLHSQYNIEFQTRQAFQKKNYNLLYLLLQKCYNKLYNQERKL